MPNKVFDMSDGVSVESRQFEAQITELLSRHKMLKQENVRLRQRVAECQQEIVKLEARLENLSADYERLKLARMFGWSEESKRQANDRLTKLVRDIDRCLLLLNE